MIPSTKRFKSILHHVASYALLPVRVWRALVWLRRATGLRSLDYIFSRSRTQSELEEAKVVLHKSFWIALSRCAVHFIPIASFGVLLYANYRTVFIGSGFSVNDEYDALYGILFQLAAKGQEMLCVASLATIILGIIQQDVLHGDGLPFSLLSAHLWFMEPHSILQPEYLCPAKEQFHEAFSSSFGRRRSRNRASRFRALIEHCHRVRLVFLLPVFVILAALIGPITAVLLIPRSLSFPAGGTDYLLTATADERWPSVIDTSLEPNICSWSNATLYPVCPSSGYSPIQHRLSINPFYDSVNRFVPSKTADESVDGESFALLDQMDIMPAMLNINSAFGNCQPGALDTVTLQTLTRDWYSAAWDPSQTVEGAFTYVTNFKYASKVSAASDTFYPMSVARCSAPQNLSQTSDTADFRYLKSSSFSAWSPVNDTRSTNISHLARNVSQHLRAQWVPLDPARFGPVSAGLLLELPWSQSSNSRLVTTCSIAAAWVFGSIHRVSSNDDAWYAECPDIGEHTIKSDIGPNDPMAKKVARRIEMSPSWLQMLAPQAPDPPTTNDTWRPTTLENMFVTAGFDTLLNELRSKPHLVGLYHACVLQHLNANLTDLELYNTYLCGNVDRLSLIETTIARVMSDGLSRRLSIRAYDTSPPLREWFANKIGRTNPLKSYGRRLLDGGKANAVNISTAIPAGQIIQRIDYSVTGLGYKLASTPDHLATVVVMVYLAFSLSHVILSLWSRTTSSCWDTASELILLAFNSPSSKAFHGTSAGIERSKTLKHRVKIRAIARDEAALAVGEVDDAVLELRLIADGAERTEPHELRDLTGVQARPKAPDPMTQGSTKSMSEALLGAGLPDEGERFLKVQSEKKYL